MLFYLFSLKKLTSLMTKLMPEEVRIAVIFVCAISCIVVDGAVSVSVSVSCMMAYNEGGAPAVFHSPECPHWVLNTQSPQNRTANCQFATLQGHREYQEDRIACNHDMNIPFLGKDGPKEAKVGVLAIFDGHGGKEASEMASKYLLDYFFLHVVFGTYKQAIPYKGEHDLVLLGNNEMESHNSNLGSSHGALPVADESIHEILKEALLRTIHDIDTKFTLEALDKNYISGSTVAVALLLNAELLVANVGDSKALMCSERQASHQDAKGSSTKELYAEELSRDHHPDREDENSRIKAAGGFVRVWGVPRVNGILAVSRSIGDVNLKRYGVIAVPEVIGWRRLSTNNSYLVIASDGIFEVLSPQNVCDLLGDGSETPNDTFPCLPSSSLADCIVNTALRKGSTDNLSAIVVPLKPLADFSKEPAEAM